MIVDPYRFADAAAAGYLDPFWPTSLYSMRKRNSAYSGYCVKVRNTTTEVETDIGFDVEGWIDAVALAACRVGSQVLVVVTWYDQSGSANHAAQSTPGYQPHMTDTSGGIYLFHGKPCMRMETGDDHLTVASNAIFGFGTGAWSVEAFVGIDALSTTDFSSAVDFRTTTVATQFACGALNSRRITLYNGSAFIGDAGPVLANSTDYSLAYTSPGGGGNILQFVDGNQESSTADSTDMQSARPMTIGNNLNRVNRFAAYFGEVAIVKGVQQYTGSFTPRSYT